MVLRSGLGLEHRLGQFGLDLHDFVSARITFGGPALALGSGIGIVMVCSFGMSSEGEYRVWRVRASRLSQMGGQAQLLSVSKLINWPASEAHLDVLGQMVSGPGASTSAPLGLRLHQWKRRYRGHWTT